MKDKIYQFLTKPYSVVAVILVATLLSLADRNFGYFFGLGVVLFLAKKEKWDWANFGFGRKISFQTVIKSLWLAILFFLGSSLIDTFLQQYFGDFNLSSLDDIRGDFGNYAIIMVVMWVFAAFGEELLFRGYYTQRFAKLFGDSNTAWIASIILIDIYIGLSHSYQGTAGAIAVTLSGFFFYVVNYTN